MHGANDAFEEELPKCPKCGKSLEQSAKGVRKMCPCLKPKVLNRTVGAGRPKPRRSASTHVPHTPPIPTYFNDDMGALGTNYSLPSPPVDFGVIRAPEMHTGINQLPDVKVNSFQQNMASQNTQAPSLDQFIIHQNFLNTFTLENSAMYGNTAPMDYELSTPVSTPHNSFSTPDHYLNSATNAPNMDYSNLLPTNCHNPQLNLGQVPINYQNVDPLYYGNYVPQLNNHNNFELGYNASFNYMPVQYQHTLPTAINYAPMNYGNNFINYPNHDSQNFGHSLPMVDFGINPPLTQSEVSPQIGFTDHVNSTEEEGACGGILYFRSNSSTKPEDKNIRQTNEIKIRSRKQRSPRRYIRKQLIKMDEWSVVDIEAKNDIKIELNEDISTFHSQSVFGIKLTNDYDSFYKIAYFSAPSDYLGNKVSSYGGFLKYAVHNTTKDIGYNVIYINFIITGLTEVLMYADIVQPAFKVKWKFLIWMTEKSFIKFDGSLITRKEFMKFLRNVTGIYIRATYRLGVVVARLINVSLEYAEEIKDRDMVCDFEHGEGTSAGTLDYYPSRYRAEPAFPDADSAETDPESPQYVAPLEQYYNTRGSLSHRIIYNTYSDNTYALMNAHLLGDNPLIQVLLEHQPGHNVTTDNQRNDDMF